RARTTRTATGWRSSTRSARRRRRRCVAAVPVPPRWPSTSCPWRRWRRRPLMADRKTRSTAAEIVFSDVTKRYPGRRAAAVEHLSLVVPAGEICVLVGPSGAGKTTAMKLVNRLIDFDQGDITIDGRSVRELDATELRRGIGYVIQQVGLFPHMTVGDNVAVVPRLLGWPRQRIRDRVVELIEL